MDFALADEQTGAPAIPARVLTARPQSPLSVCSSRIPRSTDRALWKQMAQQFGLHGLVVPEAYGGSGLRLVLQLHLT